MKIQRRKSFYELCFVLVSVVGILLPARLSLAQEIAPSTSNVNRKFQAKQLQEDFLIFRKVLEETHPGLYRYTVIAGHNGRIEYLHIGGRALKRR